MMRSPGFSPVSALLWENWRLTRREGAQRFAQGIIVAGAVLAWSAAFGAIGTNTARWAFFLVGMTYVPLWVSVAKLNGGRFMDGYRPGYPFYFLYTRPVPTFVLVGAPIAYLVASAVAGYVASALVLRAAFGYPFPLLSVAACIAAFHIAQWAAQWGTSNKVVQWLGSMPAGLGIMALAFWRFREWPARFDFLIGDYALLTLIGVASFGLTVAGVARQRRGDARAFNPRTTTRDGFSDWLAGLVRFPCPTTSATRAQVWFDLRSSGLLVLAIGAALAMLLPLLFAVSGPIAAVRPYAIGVSAFAWPAALLFLPGNAFGIRRRQGHAFASTFEATLPRKTAPLAGVKVLVRTACVVAALIVVGLSAWASLSLVSGWMSAAQKMAIGPAFWELPSSQRGALVGPEAHGVLLLQHTIQQTFGALAGSQLVALAIVIAIGVAVLVALRAAHAALRARYPRRLNIATWMLLVHGLVLVLLALAVRRGIASALALDTILRGTKWTVAAGTVFATVYLFWSLLRERLLPPRQAGVALLASAAFGAAWFTLLGAGGLHIASMPAIDAAWMLSPALLPLTACVLAPWSLSRIRHT